MIGLDPVALFFIVVFPILLVLLVVFLSCLIVRRVFRDWRK